ncbi:MAG: hypothetical protein LUQ39_07140 [Methanomassiliicoccales archaeon]|jgi:hypothetical protein|nr:hypothetical protein [Methanomassiliicoccales archaeon]
MNYVNVEKKKKDFLNENDRSQKEKQSSFKTFNQFLRRWESIRPPVRRDY